MPGSIRFLVRAGATARELEISSSPWAIATWWSEWHTNAPALFTQPLQLGGALAVILCLAYTIHVVIRWQSLREYSDIHGSARWAKRSDIKQSGLIKQEGVYVGEWTNGSKIYTLRHNGPEHVLCYAPPRSGKGVGLVVPTMLTWPHSAVVTDLKREIYELTAGWRGTEGKNRILRFEPASSTHSVAFNPVDEIRMGTDHETGDMQNLATLIVDPDGKGLHTLAEDSLRANDRLYRARIVSPEKREGSRHVAGS